RISVVLPAPLSPMSATISPSPSWKVSRCTPAPVRKVRVTPGKLSTLLTGPHRQGRGERVLQIGILGHRPGLQGGAEPRDDGGCGDVRLRPVDAPVLQGAGQGTCGGLAVPLDRAAQSGRGGDDPDALP